jgi:CO/xanthine dehydrogenase Mo-binding subunit
MSSATKISTRRDILGASALRPDGSAKVSGRFEFSSDLHAEHMLWGATLRSPHPFARIISIDFSLNVKLIKQFFLL